MQSLLSELKIKKNGSAVIWVDNQSAVALASNPVLHARTKHIEIDIHFVRDKVIAKEIELRHVPTVDQIADILTKPLVKQTFVRLREKLGIVSQAALGLRGRVSDHHGADDESTIHERMVHGVCTDDHNKDVDTKHEPTQIAPTHARDHMRSWRDVVAQDGMKEK